MDASLEAARSLMAKLHALGFHADETLATCRLMGHEVDDSTLLAFFANLDWQLANRESQRPGTPILPEYDRQAS